MLNQKVTKACFELVTGSLRIENNCVITDQDYLATSIDSTIVLKDSQIANTHISQDLCKLTETTATLSNLKISNITTQSVVNIINLSSSSLSLTSVEYKNSNVTFLVSSYSSQSLEELLVSNIVGAKTIMTTRISTVSSFKDSSFNSISVSDASLIVIEQTTVALIQNVTINEAENQAMHLVSSQVTSIKGLNLLS